MPWDGSTTAEHVWRRGSDDDRYRWESTFPFWDDLPGNPGLDSETSDLLVGISLIEMNLNFMRESLSLMQDSLTSLNTILLAIMQSHLHRRQSDNESSDDDIGIKRRSIDDARILTPKFQLFLESMWLSLEHASRHELKRIVAVRLDELSASPERSEQMARTTKHIVDVTNRGKLVDICAD
jgi:hypothetical protein